jgi:hypothetical protein
MLYRTEYRCVIELAWCDQCCEDVGGDDASVVMGCFGDLRARKRALRKQQVTP